MSDETLEKSFSVTKEAVLTVKNIAGSITLQQGEKKTIHVLAVKHLDHGDAERTQVIIEQDETGEVSAKVKFQHDGFSFLNFSHPCKVDFTITVPPNCSIYASAVSADVKAADLSGPMEFKTVSGELTLTGLLGKLSLTTVSGDIDAQALNGELSLKTVSGDICIANSSTPNFSCSTVSGNVQIESNTFSGPIACKSVSGNAKLSLPAGTQATIKSSTISGNISVNKKTTSGKGHNTRSRTIDVNGGGEIIKFSSVSGNLSIDTGESFLPEKESPQEAVEAPADDQPSRLDLLEQIAQGTLSVEEGVKLLETP